MYTLQEEKAKGDDVDVKFVFPGGKEASKEFSIGYTVSFLKAYLYDNYDLPINDMVCR
jgi:hypothetical protein